MSTGRHDETTPRLRDDPTATVLTACRIVVTAGDSKDVGRIFSLSKGSALIGRAPTCDVQINDGDVSRRHTMLTLDGAGIIVRDLESRHGTFYMGSRIERAQVPLGASITLGKTTLALLPAEGPLELPPGVTRYEDLVGMSAESRRLFATLKKLEGSDVNVLLQGEAGTGKELIARIIHRKGARGSGPFVTVDCDVGEDELNLELAGRVGRGGALEQADGGTLYLEHAHALPRTVQARLKLLVDRGETRRVDDTIRRKVRTRIITSSERTAQLADELRGSIAVVTIEVAPLRQRPDDIPLLADAIAERTKNGRPLTDAEKNHLKSQAFPGNLGDLRAAVARLVTVGLEVGRVKPAVLDDEPTDHSFKDARDRVLSAFEVDFLRNLMKRHEGNVSAAAREAQISRKHLHDLLRRHGIK